MQTRLVLVASLLLALVAAPARAEDPGDGWTVELDVGGQSVTLALLPTACASAESSQLHAQLAVTVCHRKEDGRGVPLHVDIERRVDMGEDAQKRPVVTVQKLRVQARLAAGKRAVLGKLVGPHGALQVGVTLR